MHIGKDQLRCRTARVDMTIYVHSDLGFISPQPVALLQLRSAQPGVTEGEKGRRFQLSFHP